MASQHHCSAFQTVLLYLNTSPPPLPYSTLLLLLERLNTAKVQNFCSVVHGWVLLGSYSISTFRIGCQYLKIGRVHFKSPNL